MLSLPIGRLVAFCSRRAVLVLLLFAALVGGAVDCSMHRLGVTTDTGTMFSRTLPWKQRSDELARLLPQQQDLLVAVVEADLPEEAQATARALADRLRGDSAHFLSVTLPQDNPYLVRNGLMFLDQKNLGGVLDTVVTAQPFLGGLAADPSGRGLFDSLSLIALGVSQGQANLKGFQPALDAFATTLEQAADGHAQPLSWERMLAGSLADMGGKFVFVVTRPRMDYGSFQPGGAASDAMRQAIGQLEFVRSGHAKVHLTGDVQISDEEFATVAQGMVAGLIGSLVLVTLWLFLAVRTWRIIAPIVITLVAGLLLTTGFAALAVGTLNLISVAFAVLFVGIAVDFAIQFSVRFRAQRLPSGAMPTVQAALEHTGEETGHQILVAAMATMAGFLAFTPTAFVGVAQLGLIAGFGMMIAFICTVTLLPALLRLFRPSLDHPATGFAFARPADRAVRLHRTPILSVFTFLAVLGAVLIPVLTFDADPLHTKDPNSDGMRTLKLLMTDPQTSPYGAQVLVPNLQQAHALADRLSQLPLVDDAMWLGSLVPADQPPKLAMIQDAASILLPTLVVPNPRPAPDADALRASAAKGRPGPGRRAGQAGPRRSAAPHPGCTGAAVARAGRTGDGGEQRAGALPARAARPVAADAFGAGRDPGRRPAIHPTGLPAARRARGGGDPSQGLDGQQHRTAPLCRADPQRGARRGRRCDRRGRKCVHHGPGLRLRGDVRHRHDRGDPAGGAAPPAGHGAGAGAAAAVGADDGHPDRRGAGTAQFREHHRAAAAAGRRCVLQHLFRHELAVRRPGPAVQPHGAGRPVLGPDDRDRIRLAGGIAPSGHGQHGAAAAAVAGLHPAGDADLRAGAAAQACDRRAVVKKAGSCPDPAGQEISHPDLLILATLRVIRALEILQPHFDILARRRTRRPREGDIRTDET
ncbi:putative membrane protein [Gluconacetobacter diazotrophicus PA1 5]|uniref:Putative membrane protein n=1 Tax=Gluconacetobacter diazotrophicus (strain ATCC 49037 / DSM 5601 / CCUG 37298 / CIP 103539 / LMG 7603 / PAl5) TaxID=272568 RepID=A9HDF0_GLUDA|nr:putative membrane protein [Gluconacetobacter diazotrophicus PA1 5]